MTGWLPVWFQKVKKLIYNILQNIAIILFKGKMMANMLKMNDTGSFDLVKFQSSQKESPQENKALEEEFFKFMENGIVTMKRDGENQSSQQLSSSISLSTLISPLSLTLRERESWYYNHFPQHHTTLNLLSAL